MEFPAFWLCYYAARLQAVLVDGLLSRSDRATLVRAYAQDLARFADQVAQAAQLPSSQRTQARSRTLAQHAHRVHGGPDPVENPRYAAILPFQKKGDSPNRQV